MVAGSGHAQSGTKEAAAVSIHIEWETATECEVEVMSGAEANNELHADEEVDAPFVLVLGGLSGGALAIEGTTDDLNALAQHRAVLGAAAARRRRSRRPRARFGY
jgi:hypothetical protein